MDTAGRSDVHGIFRDKFFRFRALLPGEGARGSRSIGLAGMDGVLCTTGCIATLSEMSGNIICLGYDIGRAEGDSGEELGDVSVTEGVSKVDMVVVGDDPVDSDRADDILSLCSNETG